MFGCVDTFCKTIKIIEISSVVRIHVVWICVCRIREKKNVCVMSKERFPLVFQNVEVDWTKYDEPNVNRVH